MNGWSSKDVTLAPGQVVSGVVTNQPISVEGWPITAGGATKGLVVKVKLTGVTVVGSITLKLRTAIGEDYVDAKTATVTADGDYYIKMIDIDDSADMPLLNKGQVVVTTTDADDELTVTSVNILQAL